MMRRRIVGLLAVVLSLTLVASACGSDDDDATKAAFIYVGPVGDAGWTYAHDQGRAAAAAETGVETAYVEAVPEGTAYICRGGPWTSARVPAACRQTTWSRTATPSWPPPSR